MKLWEKGIKTDQRILDFTVGKDRELDMHLAGPDIVASIAHVKMLARVGLIKNDEASDIEKVLAAIYQEVESGKFFIDKGVEDIHSQLEKTLVEKLGETGKRVHTARSRNDQVLVALKLFYRDEIVDISSMVRELALTLIHKAEQSGSQLIPGYTHMQAAMFSSFGLWFSAWAEALTEDLFFLKGVLDYVNLNPLGSAAGYGSSFPIDRDYTSKLLEFDDLHINSINAQLSRGKTEKMLLSGISAIAGTLSRMSMDMVLFINQNFDLIYLRDELTTGSSIMPHKKNPDVLEIIRAKANRIQSKEFEVHSLINNLTSGYHRDYQLLKEVSFPAIFELKDCLEVMSYIVPEIRLKENVTEKEIYKYLGSVDAINKKVMKGTSFRDAYREVAGEIKNKTFLPVTDSEHTHTGSIGNLSTDRISDKLNKIYDQMRIEKFKGFHQIFMAKIKNQGE